MVDICIVAAINMLCVGLSLSRWICLCWITPGALSSYVQSIEYGNRRHFISTRMYSSDAFQEYV